MDERLKNAAIQGNVAFLREAVASNKPIEYFKLKYDPRDDDKEKGANIFHLVAINQRWEFLRMALELLPFLVVDFLLKSINDKWKTPLDREFLLQHDEVVSLIEDFYERHNPMDSQLKNAAIKGDVEFLKEAAASKKPIGYFKSKYYPCPTRKEQGGNIFHLAAYHGRVEFFKAAMEILPISEVDILLWQDTDDHGSRKFLEHVLRSSTNDVSRFEIVKLIDEIYTSRNSMDKELKKAAIRGDVVFLREAVASNKSIEYLQSMYCVPFPDDQKEQVGNILHLAARNKSDHFLTEAVKILSEAGANVNHFLCQGDHPKYQRNPLHVAAKRRYNGIVKVILDCYENSLLSSAPANSSQPWLVKDVDGWTPFHYIMSQCREECALKLLSMDTKAFSYMDDCPGDSLDSAPFILALTRGFSKVLSKFWDSAPNWHSFDKRVLAYALGKAPNCSDEVFIRVLEQNLQLIKDMDFYYLWPPLLEWAAMGNLYPCKYVLENKVHAPHLRRYLIDQMSEENPLYNPLFHVVRSDCDEVRSIEIATIIINAYKTERRQLNTAEVKPPWFARDRYKTTPLHRAIWQQREEVALYFLSLEKIELLLEQHNFLFLAVEFKCVKVAQKILEMIDQHGLLSLLTSDTGRTILHDAPYCKGDFLRQVVKRHPQLMEQCDEDGVSVLHRWMEIGEIWPFECILKKDEFGIHIRRIFADLLPKETENTRKTPLHVAAEVGANGVIEDIVQLLFHVSREDLLTGYPEYGSIAHKDSEGNTPLDIAVSLGREKLALCLLSALDTNFIESSASNLLFKAIEKQSNSVVKHLLDIIHEEQWDPADCLRSSSQNALHVASKCTEENAKLIVERWPELINELDGNQKTPLERASEGGASWLVEMILQKDRSCILNTPFAWIRPCETGDLSTILAFVEKSIYFRYICRKYQDTPLHHIKFEDYKNYQELLSHSLIQELKDAQDSQGDTPLHKAIKDRNKDLTEILFTVGDVDWNIKNKDGKSAIDLLDEAFLEPEWEKLCDIIGIDPRKKMTYISHKTDMGQMRETISLVAALLATITFTAGFTVPGGLNDTGEAIFTKKAAFVVFLLTDTYAMCCSMLILFTVIWSMVCNPNKASFLADRSLELLKHSLSGTLLAFMTGVYVVIHKKSLWLSIVVLIMCSIVVILAQRRALYSLFDTLNWIAKMRLRVQLQLSSCWKKWTSSIKRKDMNATDAANAQNETAERENQPATSAV